MGSIGSTQGVRDSPKPVTKKMARTVNRLPCCKVEASQSCCDTYGVLEPAPPEAMDPGAPDDPAPALEPVAAPERAVALGPAPAPARAPAPGPESAPGPEPVAAPNAVAPADPAAAPGPAPVADATVGDGKTTLMVFVIGG